MKIAAVSDLHGYLPEIPECDLCILAGDLCLDKFGPGWKWPDPDGQLKWLNSDFAAWLKKIPAQQVIATCGNHDFVGEHYENAHIVMDCLVESAAGDIWVTPWSNRFMTWAFMKTPAELVEVYAKIPEGIDILVSHQPPYGYGDQASPQHRTEHLGSKELLATLARVKPKLVLCGHIHGGYGVYNVNLDDGSGLDPNEHHIKVYNVSHVNEGYQPIHPVTMIDWEPR